MYVQLQCTWLLLILFEQTSLHHIATSQGSTSSSLITNKVKRQITQVTPNNSQRKPLQLQESISAEQAHTLHRLSTESL